MSHIETFPPDNDSPPDKEAEALALELSAEPEESLDAETPPTDTLEDQKLIEPTGLLDKDSEAYKWLHEKTTLQEYQIAAIDEALQAAIVSNKDQFQIETQEELKLLQGSLTDTLKEHQSTFDFAANLPVETIREGAPGLASQVVEELARESQDYDEIVDMGVGDTLTSPDEESPPTKGLQVSETSTNADSSNETGTNTKKGLGEVIASIGVLLGKIQGWFDKLFLGFKGFENKEEKETYEEFFRNLTPKGQEILGKLTTQDLWIFNGKKDDMERVVRALISKQQEYEDRDESINMEAMAKAISGVLEETQNITVGQVIEAIDGYVSQEEQAKIQEVQEKQAAEEKRVKQESKEAETTEANFPFEHLIRYNEKNIDVMRISEQDEHGVYTFVIRGVDTGRDFYEIITSKAFDGEKFEKGEKQEIYENLGEEQQNAIGRADLRYLYKRYGTENLRLDGQKIQAYSLSKILQKGLYLNDHKRRQFKRGQNAISALGIPLKNLDQTLENYVKSLDGELVTTPTPSIPETPASPPSPTEAPESTPPTVAAEPAPASPAKEALAPSNTPQGN